jgi:hypothetical protein
MANKITLFAVILLVTFNSAFAFAGDPEVFKILRADQSMACAAIDEERAFCWESSKEKFLQLQIDLSERHGLPPTDKECNISSSYCGSLTDSNSYIADRDLSLYVSTLEELVVQMLDYNKHGLEYSKNRIAKVRAIGATIYMLYGHTIMVNVCEELPQARGIRRLVESLWDGIGYWRG